MNALNFTSTKVNISSLDLFTIERGILAAFLSLFPMATIFGNSVIIFAVTNRAYLQTPTGFLIVSLACADLLVGILVMPLNIVFESFKRVWVLGLAFCDAWHAVDVLASTASIWNLAVISLDRYIAVNDPLSYREIMLPHRVYIAITAVWLWSISISVPAIYWWRTVSPELYLDESSCRFTDDLTYVVLGSLLCFYVPLFLTLFAYSTVFKIASKREKNLTSGRVRLNIGSGSEKRRRSRTKKKSGESEIIENDASSIYMRVHRGGISPVTPTLSDAGKVGGKDLLMPCESSPASKKRSIRFRDSDPIVDNNDATNLVTPKKRSNVKVSGILDKDELEMIGDDEEYDENAPSLMKNRMKRLAKIGSAHIFQPASGAQIRLAGLFFDAMKTVGERAKENKARKAIIKFLKEKRAAKTLGIVVGCFVLCWLPYFVVNILVTVCPSCLSNPQSWFVVVTWLGHINSALNPLIYTLFNREFRRAVKSILFGSKRYTTRRGLSKAIEHSLSVMVVQVSRGKEKDEPMLYEGSPEYFL